MLLLYLSLIVTVPTPKTIRPPLNCGKPGIYLVGGRRGDSPKPEENVRRERETSV